MEPPATTTFEIDTQADTCLSNWGLQAEDIAADLGDALWSIDKTRVVLNGICVTAQRGMIISVTRARGSGTAPPPPLRAAKRPPLSRHARVRMAERGISNGDVEKALSTPRLPGAVHRHNGVTVAVGTRRGGETVATAWRDDGGDGC